MINARAISLLPSRKPPSPWTRKCAAREQREYSPLDAIYAQRNGTDGDQHIDLLPCVEDSEGDKIHEHDLHDLDQQILVFSGILVQRERVGD